MFGIGTTELLIIMLVALIVLGPTKLPGIARSLGKALGEFRRVTTDVQRTLNLEAARIEEDEKQKAKAAPSPPKQPAEKPVDKPTDNPAGMPPQDVAHPKPYATQQAAESASAASPPQTTPTPEDKA